ncbi:hypothetical protein D3H55_14210 [Bacillus salacetis]|uniref:Lipoprotein n=1 Tax=Bacillus salacetis TaxID=2315464 RepID=A0A3A1QZZ1_9BACI|nr:SurA N-terminal domain-containing protein [Bacillus salacetis]RIW32025.1 hypothetical protein D3H55_14210 [Bacillus salacetis]
MRRIFSIILLTSALSAGCGAVEKQTGLSGVDGLNEYVTEDRLERRMETLNKIDPVQSKEQSRSVAIEQLVEEYILKYEAESRDLSVSEEEIEDAIDFNIEMASQSQDDHFSKMLEDLDLTIEEYYRDYAYESIEGKLLENKLYDQIVQADLSPEKQRKMWNGFKDEITSEFSEQHEKEINELTDRLTE